MRDFGGTTIGCLQLKAYYFSIKSLLINKFLLTLIFQNDLCQLKKIDYEERKIIQFATFVSKMQALFCFAYVFPQKETSR